VILPCQKRRRATNIGSGTALTNLNYDSITNELSLTLFDNPRTCVSTLNISGNSYLNNLNVSGATMYIYMAGFFPLFTTYFAFCHKSTLLFHTLSFFNEAQVTTKDILIKFDPSPQEKGKLFPNL
jgi:hypothetical protein